MPTPFWLTGFEHGGVATVNGGGICNAMSGDTTTVSFVAGSARNGAYGLRLAPTATVAARIVRTGLTGTAAILRCYVRIDTAPASGSLTVIQFGITVSTDLPRISFLSNGNIEIGTTSTVLGNIGTWTLGTWRLIQLYASVAANPWVIRGRVDEGTIQSFNSAQAADTVSAFRIGTTSTTGPAAVVSVDDVYGSITNADWPIGAGKALPLLGNVDGTHNLVAKYQDQAGNAITALNTAFDKVNNRPFNASDTTYVQQATADVVAEDSYIEIGFDDVTETGNANGVSGFLAYGSAGTAANNGATVVRRSDGTEIAIFGTPTALVDMSDTYPFYKQAIITAPTDGWTPTQVNALLARFGYSSDVTPVPHWRGLLLEADYPIVATPRTFTVGLATETDAATTVGKAKVTSVAQSTETDTAFGLASSKLVSLLQSIETDTAQAISSSSARVIAVALATETNTATALGRHKVKGFLQAQELNVALALASRKLRSVIQALETNTASAVTVGNARVVLVQTAVESSVATTVGKAKFKSIEIATETNTASELRRVRLYYAGTAVEIDTAFLVAGSKVRSLGRAVELNTALEVMPSLSSGSTEGAVAIVGNKTSHRTDVLIHQL